MYVCVGVHVHIIIHTCVLYTQSVSIIKMIFTFPLLENTILKCPDISRFSMLWEPCGVVERAEAGGEGDDKERGRM